MLKKTGLKRTAMKRRAKSKAVSTPASTYQAVCLRSGGEWLEGRCVGGRCENPGCTHPQGGMNVLQFTHRKNRGMGGSRDPKIHSPENVERLCYACHMIGDHHVNIKL